jgi:uncharacterized protein YoxC
MDIAGLVLLVPRRTVASTLRVARATTGLIQAAEQVPALVARTEAILTAVETLLVQINEVTVAAGDVAVRVDEVRANASRVAGSVDTVQQRASRLVAAIEPLVAVVSEIDVALFRSSMRLVEDLQPLLRAATLLPPDLPKEAAELVRQSLPLIEELNATLKPLLGDLQGAIPDIGKILAVIMRLEPVVTDVETRIAGLPGAGRLRRRGQREIEAAANGSTSAQ